MLRDGMRGFASLRTRPSVPEPTTPRRFCPDCGAALRPSNPGPLCAPCSHEPVEVPEYMTAMVDFDDRPTTVNTLAALLDGYHVQTGIKARNAGIRAGYEAGMSKADLAEMYCLSWGRINDVLAGRRLHH